jgi:hypothetical protein
MLLEAVYQMLIELAPLCSKRGDAWWKFLRVRPSAACDLFFLKQISELKVLNRGRVCHEEYSQASHSLARAYGRGDQQQVDSLVNSTGSLTIKIKIKFVIQI